MPFKNFEEIESLVRAFERVEISPGCWDHRAHLTVACWYLLCYPFPDAARVMREGLHRHLAAWGIETTLERGYHETITISWLKLLKHHLAGVRLERTLVELINEVIDTFGKKDYLFEYFTRERLMSWEARRNWMEPDLKSFPSNGHGSIDLNE
jgi:hypothetical protein